MHADHELNRASWDILAAVHGQDQYYDSEALLAGASSLIEEEEAALLRAVGSRLSGLRVLQVQCHLGFDAITFARRGAGVTGLDFSTVALGRAERLARQCGVEIDWLSADATALPDALVSAFDLAWATMGILCWIADASAWMRSVSRALRPGGKLVLIDGHPGRELPGHGSRATCAPTRRFINSGWDYASETRTGPQVQFRHSMEGITEAAHAAGLRIRLLEEHSAISHHLRIPTVRRDDDGRYRHRVNGKAQPVLFTLIAERSSSL